MKDNLSSSFDSNAITWEEVYVTTDPKDAEGLIAVESITETSGWGGSVGSDLGVRNCIKGIQQKAAKKGCCLAVVTHINRGFTTSVTATIYKRP